MMMACLLRLVSTSPLLMRFDGLLLRNDKSCVHNFHNSKVVLDLLMVHLLKSIGLGTI